jgi:Na+/proline symporter
MGFGSDARLTPRGSRILALVSAAVAVVLTVAVGWANSWYTTTLTAVESSDGSGATVVAVDSPVFSVLSQVVSVATTAASVLAAAAVLLLVSSLIPRRPAVSDGTVADGVPIPTERPKDDDE